MSNEKQAKVRGTINGSTYEVFEDGSLTFPCKSCRREVAKTAEEATKFMRNESWAQTFDFLCLDCWKQGQEAKKSVRPAIGQATNLAQSQALWELQGVRDERSMDAEALTALLVQRTMDLTPLWLRAASDLQAKLPKGQN